MKPIGTRTIPFFDDTRNRPIITELFYPVNERSHTKKNLSASIWQQYPEARNAPIDSNHKYPLIMFSHGNAGSRLENAWLIYNLVKNGYLVASVEHFGNTWDLNEIEESWKRWNRAQDISFVIKKILKNPDFSGYIHKDQIGFSGFSLGGLTGIWLAGARANLIETALQKEADILNNINLDLAKESYHEPLIKAGFLMAPAYGLAFDQHTLSKIQIPMFIVIGGRDKVVPKQEAQYLNNHIPNCKLKVLHGFTGHFVFINRPTILGKILLPKSITLDHLRNNTTKIQQDIAKKALDFFNENLF